MKKRHAAAVRTFSAVTSTVRRLASARFSVGMTEVLSRRKASMLGRNVITGVWLV